MFNCKKQNQNAFTLIELLVVISIIGILSTVSVISYNAVRIKERDNRRVVDMNKIAVAFENYRSLYGRYPACDVPGCDYETQSSSWYTCLGVMLKPFIGNIPVDPGNISGQGYCYSKVSGAAGNTISITFLLENYKAISGVTNAVATSTAVQGVTLNVMEYSDKIW